MKFDFHGQPAEITHGSVFLAAVCSSTNSSNPSVMIGAGLVAKKACELGLEVCSFIMCSHLLFAWMICWCLVSSLAVTICFLLCKNTFLQVKPWVKTSLAPGSLVVTKYFEHMNICTFATPQPFEETSNHR